MGRISNAYLLVFRIFIGAGPLAASIGIRNCLKTTSTGIRHLFENNKYTCELMLGEEGRVCTR